MAVLEDVFRVTAVDSDGKVFDRVSRIKATSESHGMDLSLDINCELFPLKSNDKVSLLVAKSLSLDEASGAASGASGYRMQGTGPSLADKFDYVMHGKVYKLENLPNGKMALYVSFGGLLMRVEANPRALNDVTNGSNLYLLMKRI